MEVSVDPVLLELVESIDENIFKAVNEGLTLWLKQKLAMCPITKKFCTNGQNPCNDCSTFDRSL